MLNAMEGGIAMPETQPTKDWIKHPACPPGMELVTEGKTQGRDLLWSHINWSAAFPGVEIEYLRSAWIGPFACARPIARPVTANPDDLNARVEALVQWSWDGKNDYHKRGVEDFSAAQDAKRRGAAVRWSVERQVWYDASEKDVWGVVVERGMAESEKTRPVATGGHQHIQAGREGSTPSTPNLSSRFMREVNRRLPETLAGMTCSAELVDDGAQLMFVVRLPVQKPTNTDEAQALTDAILKWRVVK